MNRLILFFALTLLVLSPFASADIPRLISLQGRLTDASDNPISSSANFAFRIYDAPTGGTPLWAEFQTLSPNSLGIFSALLGSVAALNIPFNTSYWLEVQVNSEVLSPRQRMGSAGYALRSENPWNATGNDIYTTNAGNVGIGTSSPAQKLTVSGDVSWTGTLQGGSVPWARLSSVPNYAGSSSLGGPATTATALAANGANCAAGQYAQGVDTSGNAEGCGAPAAGVPSGAVMFFNLASCPSGWTELTSARGRYVVGLPSGGTLAGTAGTALTNLEDRPVGQHTHGITDPGHYHEYGSYGVPWYYSQQPVPTTAGAGMKSTVSTTGISINNAGSVAGTNAPYIQLLACQKS